jgi:hypothetical protein
VSRTNLYVLIATALLGVLLVVVRQIGQHGPGPDGPEPQAAVRMPATGQADGLQASAPPAAGPPLTRIADVRGLVDFLDGLGLDGAALVRETAGWYRDRGQLGPIELLGIDQATAPARYYDSLDDATLRALSASGDAGATQILADRKIWSDPLRTLGIDYLEAARQGSVYAAFRAASVWQSLAGLDPATFPPDSGLRKDLEQLGADRSLDLQFNALVNALVGVQDGGPPVVDDDTLRWLEQMEAALPGAMVERACGEAFRVYLGLGNVRRGRSVPPVNVTPPPVFLSVPDLEDRLPCGETGSPLFSTLDTTRCKVQQVQNAAGELRDLYVCRP